LYVFISACVEGHLKKYNIILSGPSLSDDKELKNALRKIAKLYENPVQEQIGILLKEFKCHLILFEVSKSNPNGVEILQTIKKYFPETLVLLFVHNNDLNLIAKGIDYGAKDVFKSPYKYELIVERAEAFLRHYHI
jgi:response regulator RpfG family c-di-GMP phosphodiesterase